MFANTLLFGDDGEFTGFDATEPTSRSGGKAQAIEQIKKVCPVYAGISYACYTRTSIF